MGLEIHLIRPTQGGSFPSPGNGQEAVDPESLRRLPHRRALIWSSEGDARDGFGPAIRTMSLTGRPIRSFNLPPMFEYDRLQARGPRPNLSIEGLSVEPSGRNVWISLEAPLVEDGTIATRELGVPVRLSRLRFPELTLIEQFAYYVEPIGPAPEGRLADNGVSEILALDSQHILVLERSGLQQNDGDFTYHSRLFCADITMAQNIATQPSLANLAVPAARKHLVFDFDDIPSPVIDNVEGMTFGPTLPNGHQTIVFITDNDFSPRRQTQLITMEIVRPHEHANLVETLCQSVGDFVSP